jgi:hypothetical protein
MSITLKGKNKSNASNEMKVDPSKRITGGDSEYNFLFETMKGCVTSTLSLKQQVISSILIITMNVFL